MMVAYLDNLVLALKRISLNFEIVLPVETGLFVNFFRSKRGNMAVTSTSIDAMTITGGGHRHHAAQKSKNYLLFLKM